MSQFSLDKQQIRQSFAKASLSYDGMASLQRKVGRELIKRVSLAEQAHVLDLGCGTGFFTQQLQQKVGLKNAVALDLAMPMLLQARARLAEYDLPLVCADAEALPFTDACVSGVVSNLALQWCLQLDVLFKDVARVLDAGGQFVFSTFGAGALSELKNAWAAVDDYPHVNEFCAVADLEQALCRSGFVDVQLDTEVYVTHYASPMELMRELKGIGAHNVQQARKRNLTSKGQLQKLLAAYPQQDDGSIIASFEIIYVQASVRK